MKHIVSVKTRVAYLLKMAICPRQGSEGRFGCHEQGDLENELVWQDLNPGHRLGRKCEERMGANRLAVLLDVYRMSLLCGKLHEKTQPKKEKEKKPLPEVSYNTEGDAS